MRVFSQYPFKAKQQQQQPVAWGEVMSPHQRPPPCPKGIARMSLYARGLAYKPTEGVDRYTLTDTPNTLGNLVA